jgi:hypothetical protein
MKGRQNQEPNIERQSDQGGKPKKISGVRQGENKNKERSNQEANQTGKKGSHGGNR